MSALSQYNQLSGQFGNVLDGLEAHRDSAYNLAYQQYENDLNEALMKGQTFIQIGESTAGLYKGARSIKKVYDNHVERVKKIRANRKKAQGEDPADEDEGEGEEKEDISQTDFSGDVPEGEEETETIGDLLPDFDTSGVQSTISDLQAEGEREFEPIADEEDTNTGDLGGMFDQYFKDVGSSFDDEENLGDVLSADSFNQAQAQGKAPAPEPTEEGEAGLPEVEPLSSAPPSAPPPQPPQDEPAQAQPQTQGQQPSDDILPADEPRGEEPEGLLGEDDPSAINLQTGAEREAQEAQDAVPESEPSGGGNLYADPLNEPTPTGAFGTPTPDEIDAFGKVSGLGEEGADALKAGSSLAEGAESMGAKALGAGASLLSEGAEASSGLFALAGATAEALPIVAGVAGLIGGVIELVTPHTKPQPKPIFSATSQSEFVAPHFDTVMDAPSMSSAF